MRIDLDYGDNAFDFWRQAVWTLSIMKSGGLCCDEGQCHSFQRGQIEPVRCAVDVEAHNLAQFVKVDDQAIGHFA